MSVYSPTNGASVPPLRSTWYSAGLSAARHSSSLRTTSNGVPSGRWAGIVPWLMATTVRHGEAPRLLGGTGPDHPR